MKYETGRIVILRELATEETKENNYSEILRYGSG